MSPEAAVIVVWVAVVIFAALVGFALGVLWERDRRDNLVEEAATAAVDELVARQAADDRAAIASLPPGIEAGDAVTFAADHGISVREAALILFRTQARARIQANTRRHHPANRRQHP